MKNNKKIDWTKVINYREDCIKKLEEGGYQPKIVRTSI